MGCWNGTCMITNLPIQEGEKVKLVFLKKNPHHTITNASSVVYHNDLMRQVAFPIEGEYDDYGGIEKVVEDWNFKIIEVYFKSLFKEIEVEGEVKKEFTLYDIIEGLERRSLRALYLDEELKERIELAKEAVNVYSRSGYGSEKVKREWETLANREAKEEWHESEFSFVFIRKDVWDSICNEHTTEIYLANQNKSLTTDEFIAQSGNKTILFKSMFHAHDWLPDFFHYAYLEAYKKEAPNFLEYWNQYRKINSFLSYIRKTWMIQSGAGSQGQDWKSYKLLTNIINEVCDKHIEEEK